ncbi:MAG: nitrate reductase cytochrome c-type subunit [Anaeromyxobacteraceae bacterium]
MTTLRAPLAALALLALAAPVPGRPGTPDTKLGLSKTSVFEIPAPPAYKAEDSTPGEKPLPKRLSTEIPPVIPHGIDELLPITRESNACVACHDTPGPKKKGEPTPIPASHHVDFRHDGRKAETVAGARWVCISCHVPRTDAKPLVGSR